MPSHPLPPSPAFPHPPPSPLYPPAVFLGKQALPVVWKQIYFLLELGTRQSFNFATTTTRQCYSVIDHQGQEKIWQLLRPQCLNGKAISNIDIWQLTIINRFVLPENMVTLSRQCFRVPSSASYCCYPYIKYTLLPQKSRKMFYYPHLRYHHCLKTNGLFEAMKNTYCLDENVL